MTEEVRTHVLPPPPTLDTVIPMPISAPLWHTIVQLASVIIIQVAVAPRSRCSPTTTDSPLATALRSEMPMLTMPGRSTVWPRRFLITTLRRFPRHQHLHPSLLLFLLHFPQVPLPSREIGNFALPAQSAKTSAAAASIRQATAFSSAPLWVASSLGKAVLMDHPLLPPILGNGKNVATVLSATTSAAAASTRMASSSAPLWVGSSIGKAVLEAQHAVSAETTKTKFPLLMKPTPPSCTMLHQWRNLGVTLS